MSKRINYQKRSDNLKDALRELDEMSKRDPKWKAFMSKMSSSELQEIAPGYASITLAEWLASLALPPKRVEGNWTRAACDLSDPPIDLERAERQLADREKRYPKFRAMMEAGRKAAEEVKKRASEKTPDETEN